MAKNSLKVGRPSAGVLLPDNGFPEKGNNKPLSEECKKSLNINVRNAPSISTWSGTAKFTLDQGCLVFG
jgi:hypothetical protein